MSLFSLAKSDLASIVSAGPSSPSEPMVLTSPEGVESGVDGIQNDTTAAIDSETGEEVSVRMMELSLVTASLSEMPQVQHRRHAKPWTVTIGTKKWRIADVFPDGTLGRVRIKVEAYDELD